jgi:hypothetical protein
MLGPMRITYDKMIEAVSMTQKILWMAPGIKVLQGHIFVYMV